MYQVLNSILATSQMGELNDWTTPSVNTRNSKPASKRSSRSFQSKELIRGRSLTIEPEGGSVAPSRQGRGTVGCPSQVTGAAAVS